MVKEEHGGVKSYDQIVYIQDDQHKPPNWTLISKSKAEKKSWNKFLPCWESEPLTSQSMVQHANHYRLLCNPEHHQKHKQEIGEPSYMRS